MLLIDSGYVIIARFFAGTLLTTASCSILKPRWFKGSEKQPPYPSAYKNYANLCLHNDSIPFLTITKEEIPWLVVTTFISQAPLTSPMKC